MVGITSCGAYIPMLRLPLAMIGGGKPGGPNYARAVKRAAEETGLRADKFSSRCPFSLRGDMSPAGD